MRHKAILALLILIVLLPACNRVVPSDAVPDDRTIISISQLNMDDDAALEIVKIVEIDDYNFNFEFTKVRNDVIESENIIELFGKVNSVSQVDITNDGNTDILISADEGGSVGSTVYYYLSSVDNELISMDLNELINGENYNFEFDKDGVQITGSDMDENIKFNNRVMRTLEDMGVSLASKYELLPAILSFSNTYDHNIIITAKRVLIVEHKLNAVAEIRTDYIYKKGWTKLNTDITVLD